MSQQHSLLSPFARHRPAAGATSRVAPPPQPSFAAAQSAGENSRHRLSALGALPVPLSSALRQRELQPGADRCSVGCGTAGLTWAALGSTLYVWRAAAPQGCIRLASPLPSEEATAQSVCEIQPGAGEADEVLLLCCWASRASCRLTLYRLEALSEPPRLASPPPVYDLAVPLPANSTALFLRATPGTVAPAFAPAAAILATSASQLFAVSLESSVGVPSAAKPGLALSLSPLERSSGSLSRVITAVSSYFSSSQRAGPTAPLAALSLASDWMVTLSSAGATDTAAETIVDCWKRNGTGQSYTHAGGSPLLPLLQPALAHAGRGDAAFLAGRCHVADACVLPAEQPGADGRLLLLLATRGAAGGAAAGATYDLGLVEMSIAQAARSGLPPAAPTLSRRRLRCAVFPSLMAALLRMKTPSSPLSLVTASRPSGPAVALRPSAALGRAVLAPGGLGGGEAFALRDRDGEPSYDLIGVAGGAGGGLSSAGAGATPPLLGQNGLQDAKLLGAGGNEQGVLLMFSHQIVRLEARPSGGGGGAGGSGAGGSFARGAAVRRVSVGGAAGGAAGAGGGGGGAAANAHVDPEFARELAEAFQQYEAMQRDGWRGATDKGRGVEEMASGREAMCVAALLALSRALASAAVTTHSEAALASKLAQQTRLVEFARLHSLLDPAASPHEAAELVAIGERLAAGLALRQTQNGASAAHSTLLIALLDAVHRQVPGGGGGGGGGRSVAVTSSSPDGVRTRRPTGRTRGDLFRLLLLDGRWRVSPSRGVAAGAAVADEQRLPLRLSRSLRHPPPLRRALCRPGVAAALRRRDERRGRGGGRGGARRGAAAPLDERCGDLR